MMTQFAKLTPQAVEEAVQTLLLTSQSEFRWSTTGQAGRLLGRGDLIRRSSSPARRPRGHVMITKCHGRIALSRNAFRLLQENRRRQWRVDADGRWSVSSPGNVAKC